jgi:pimeloyl-ACP methyl ester carboxylesterase
MTDTLSAAEARLFDSYRIPFEARSVRLEDPHVEIAIRETGSGDPVVFVHGSGMSGASWAPLLAHLPDRHAIALDLPGFGHSDSYSYTGRPLREHAVAQLTSALDALGLERAALVGTSLGAMWVLNLALAAPGRVSAVVALGMPAVALPGLRPDPFFKLLTTPGLGRLAARGPAPKSAAAARKGMSRALGPRALERTPDEFFDVVRAGMATPGWGRAMWSHLNLAMRSGRARPENLFSDDELRSIATPVQLIWGDRDVYGGPEIGERAAALLADARLELIEGGHAPFLDEPERCAELIRQATMRPRSRISMASEATDPAQG